MEFANRMLNIKKSYIREILKVAEKPEIISFAGGLPNPHTFPVEAIKMASDKVLTQFGKEALQYSSTEGYGPLREYIATRYKKRFGLEISSNEILITTGSQQGLDLIGKVFLNPGDEVIIEEPGYLGAIQSLSVFEPTFIPISLEKDGINLEEVQSALKKHVPKLFYAVPSFQNPTGLSYKTANLQSLAELLKRQDRTVFIADDPYGELRFNGEETLSIKTLLNDQAILLGSFSKVVSPGMRIGWVCASREIIDKLIIVKQAADLHTNYLSQRILFQYLCDNDFEAHIQSIKELYGKQKLIMENAIKQNFPVGVETTNPDGGMFLWVTLPANMSALKLLEQATKMNVAFVPGDPFYVDETDVRTFRLNYTNSTEEEIYRGIENLGVAIKSLL